MTRPRIRVNQRGIEALKGLPAIGDAMHQKAEPVLAAAEAGAPVLTGAYKSSLRIVDDVVDGVRVARVVAGVPYAVFVEAETGNLSRALDAAR